MSQVEEKAPDQIVCAESDAAGHYAGWCGIVHADELEGHQHIAGELEGPDGNKLPALGDGWEVSSNDQITARREAEANADEEAATAATAAAVAAANAPAAVDPTSIEGRLRALESSVFGDTSAADDTGATYADMTKAELADELAARELPVSGTKDELVARLEDDDAATPEA